MEYKHCSKCKQSLPLSSYYKNNKGALGVTAQCKECTSTTKLGWKYSTPTERRDRDRTKDGMIDRIYFSQLESCKQRGCIPPSYTKQELYDWMLKQDNFKNLFNTWVTSDYLKDLKPSIDRLDDYISYTLDNIRLVTWKDNMLKAAHDRKEGINNKANNTVNMLTLSGVFIKQFHSANAAARAIGKEKGAAIGQVCKNKRYTAYGYKWEYA